MNIFVCKFVYIVRTDQNPLGSCQPFSILYIMMTACAAAYRATCGISVFIEQLKNRLNNSVQRSLATGNTLCYYNIYSIKS